MAQIVKSVLFFDYDSVKRSLAGHGPEVAEVFASKARDWLVAIEDGSLLLPRPSDQVRRKLLVKRCYADPKTLGEDRDWLTANGVQVVDCPPLAGHSRNAADLHMVLDTDDAINHATGFNEFILLSADADLTPILFRLRAHDRSSIIYSNPITEANYKALADGVVDERSLIGVLIPGRATGAKLALAYAKDETPPAARSRKAKGERAAIDDSGSETGAAPGLLAGGKEELAALVRQLHQATRVPLFSPRTFEELFRLLAEEVARNGYRFQTTAENVAAKLIASGRKATRRQVGFVVKGLALKGHVFSPDDRPQDLAREFRDQVLYLCKSANVTLTDRELGLLTAWVAGGTATSEPAAAPARVGVVERVRKSVVSRITGGETPKRGAKGAGRAGEPEPEPKATAARKSAAAELEEAETPPAVEPEADSEEAAVTEPVAESERMEEAAEDAPALEAPAPAEAEPAAEAAPELEATPAARETRSGKASAHLSPIPDAPRMTPTRKPSLVGAKRAAAARGAAKAAAASKKPAPALPDTEEVENSILAAIAEAVDVLVEDRATDTVKPKGERGEAPEATADAPAHEPEPGEESDDIGDEIQRILASYSQGRSQNER